MRNTRKYFLVFIIVLIILLLVGLLIRHINSQQTITITFKNVRSVVIKEDYVANKTKKNTSIVLGDIESNKAYTLWKGNYIISYTPSEGYEKKDIYVSLFDEQKNIQIDPHYTETKLEDMRKKEFTTIKSSLQTKLAAITRDYTIQPGKLYGRGEWYGTTLQYIGDYPDNADTLRVVMNKQNNSWQIATQPPAISLSKYIYKDIPKYILDDVNNSQNTPLIDKYLNPDTSH